MQSSYFHWRSQKAKSKTPATMCVLLHSDVNAKAIVTRHTKRGSKINIFKIDF